MLVVMFDTHLQLNASSELFYFAFSVKDQHKTYPNIYFYTHISVSNATYYLLSCLLSHYMFTAVYGHHQLNTILYPNIFLVSHDAMSLPLQVKFQISHEDKCDYVIIFKGKKAKRKSL
jgi:hypothetical protein